jgi:pyruvate formate lyase activating enzyme
MTTEAAGSRKVRRLPLAPRPPLGDELAGWTAPARLARQHGDAVECTACAHACRLREGQRGLCGVRLNSAGILRGPWGYVARHHVRAVETNTMYHVRPGARALTFGMYGCDLRCPYCQNWATSQALREGVAEENLTPVTPAGLVAHARWSGAEVLCAAYNEPMIAAEWVRAVFEEARGAGLLTGVVSDGNTTEEALRWLRPVTDVFRVDLKAGTDEQYRALGGRLEPVLRSISEARRLGYWVEVVTLVVPRFNDDPRELRRMADMLREIDPELPWHLNGFVPRYKMEAVPPTAPGALVSAAGTAYARGQSFVYVGNVAGAATGLEHTRCPGCHATLVERRDYSTVSVALDGEGRCPTCLRAIPGLWRPA